MDILSYVQELLQQQAAVCVTGLGTFYKKKSAGRYDKEKKAFVPPSYVLQFSATTEAQDELANFISGKKEISAETASYYINIFAEEVNKKLELEHEAYLAGLGRLYFTEHEGLSFDPEKNINLGSEFFGLPEIPQDQTEASSTQHRTEQDADLVHEEIAEAPKAQDFEQKAETPKALPVIENIDLDEVKDDLKHTLKHSDVDWTVTAEESKTDESLEDVQLAETTEAPAFMQEQHQEHPNRFGHDPALDENVSDSENEQAAEITEAPAFIQEQHLEHPNRFGHDPALDENDQEKSPWLKIALGILVLAVIAIGIYLAKPEWFKPAEKTTVPIQAPDSSQIDSARIQADSVKIKQDSIAKTYSILKAHAVKPTKDSLGKKAVATAVTASAVQGLVTYDIIAASFKTEAKAEVFVRQMKAYGLNARVVSLPGRLKKVSIASFSTEKEAYEKRPELAEKIKIKDLDIIQINTAP